MIHFFMNFSCINHFSASLEVSTKNINYKGCTLAHFVLFNTIPNLQKVIAYHHIFNWA